MASAAVRRLALAGTPYGHSEDGTIAAVKRLSREDLRAFYDDYYQPANAVLAVVGDIQASEAFAEAEKNFGAWTNRTPPRPPAASPGGPGASDSGH